MNISIVAIGSRGDTQPYLALAVALQQAGYRVKLCAGDNFRDFVTEYGIEFIPVGVNIQAFINERIPQVLESGRNTYQALHTVLREGLSYADEMWVGMQAACGDAELIAMNFPGIGAAAIAEKREIPAFLIHCSPIFGRTRTAPPMIFPIQRNFGGVINGALHGATELFLQQLFRRGLNNWRAEMDLAPVPRFGWSFNAFPNKQIPMLYAHSPAVLPRPSDWQSDWHVTGYWFLDAPPDWQPPADLLDFLRAGEKPVYIGFGSMSGRKPEEMTELVVSALKQSGQRGVIAYGWGGLSQADLPDNIYALQAIPHSWLFSQVAGVVHHGGAGTTAAGFRAGVPTIVVPHFGDQQFWGMRAEKLGVGTAPIPRSKITADRLAQALTQIRTDTTIQQNAAALGDTIRAEDGTGNTIQIMESYVG